MDLFNNMLSPSRKSTIPSSNENLAPSRQRPAQSPRFVRPSAIPRTPAKHFQSLSESDTNARSFIPQPQPQQSNGLAVKHKPSGLPEPAMKRKTLAERAVEPYRPNLPAPPSSRPVASGVKTAALSGLRNASFSSSGSSRPPSVSSRTVSGSSMTSSVGTGSRSTSLQGSNRSQSALSYAKKFGPNTTISNRPGTALELNSIEERDQTVEQDGMRFARNTFAALPAFRLQKQRRNLDQADIYTAWAGNLAQSHSHAQQHNSYHSPLREISITSGMQQLSLGTNVCSIPEEDYHADGEERRPTTPSYIPRSVSPTKKSARSSLSPIKPSASPMFLNKYSNVQAGGPWDAKDRIDEHMEQFLEGMKQINSRLSEQEAGFKSSMIEQVELYKIKLNELESIRMNLSTTNSLLQSDLEDVKSKLSTMTLEFDNTRRANTIELDDMRRKHRNELDDLDINHQREADTSRKQAEEEMAKVIRTHAEGAGLIEKQLKAELEEERSRRSRELQEVTTQFTLQRQRDEIDTSNKDRELRTVKNELVQARAEIEQERVFNTSLKNQLSERATAIAALEASMQDMLAKIKYLESNSETQSHAYAEMNQRMQDAINSATEANAKLRAEETLRRKLHNQVQELKGNIRVFCRMRPALGAEAEEAAKISIPDAGEESKELLVMGPEQKSSLGNISSTKNNFNFDRVFGPSSQNAEIFEEISQLVQSALDGYNVCIFCYGQTGSGKTHTMSSADGMIPLAVHQIYSTATSLAEKGWKYTMEGSFVEVYNENLNDLLGKADDLDKKKHEIRHDNAKGKTTITDVEIINLNTPDMVVSLLERAAANRSVAATKANERSSRSHSVFILRLTGENSITGERSEGTLNLVDLAGSERLSHSGATGERLKETQSINRSLSCLGDVISALGQGKEGGHVPYRNSKLTYLLQHSLGGNSKTLMFVMVSPLQAHLNETLTSLKFATKVHNVHIGTAKRQSKIRDVP